MVGVEAECGESYQILPYGSKTAPNDRAGGGNASALLGWAEVSAHVKLGLELSSAVG